MTPAEPAVPDVTMPRLSDSMQVGTIVRWLVPDGEEVVAGQELVEIETDKATITHEAEATGTLRTLAAEGDSVPVGAPIARIGDAAPAIARTAESDGPRVSPVARRLADEIGVDLATVAGTGPGGRIVKADVQARAQTTRPEREPEPEPMPTSRGAVRGVELTRLQRTVALRMAQIKASVPDFSVSTTVSMDGAVRIREELQQDVDAFGPPPSLNDLVVRACGLALRAFPRVNAVFRDGRFELYERVDIGVAVAAGEALLVPVITDADRKSIRTIAREARELARRARDGAIAPHELDGGTFTVSNLGMYGATRFTAIVNRGQAAILAVGALEERPVVRDGTIVAGFVMELTLTCDHRILYGADAARFLGHVRGLLERPLAMMVC